MKCCICESTNFEIIRENKGGIPAVINALIYSLTPTFGIIIAAKGGEKTPLIPEIALTITFTILIGYSIFLGIYNAKHVKTEEKVKCRNCGKIQKIIYNQNTNVINVNQNITQK